MTKLKNIFQGERIYVLGLLLISVVVMSFAVLTPIKLSPDSDGYITAAIYRSPVYPVFLKFLEMLFGSFKNIAVVILQTLLGLGASFYLIRALKKFIQLNNLWLLILFGMMVYPYISEQLVGNRVLSEGLSYPLYLIAVALLFKAFVFKSSKYLVRVLFVLFLLLLTRTQFSFLVPIAILISGKMFFCDKSSKKLLLIGLSFVALPIITNVVDKTYHHFQHDYFVSTPWTGIHVLTPAMFTANEGDATLFEEEQERRYFQEMFKVLKSRGLNVNHKLNPNEPDIDIYVEAYSEIANATLFYEGLRVASDGQITDENFILIDQLTKSMTPKLTWDNKVDWLKVYIMNIVHGFGSVSHFLVFVILFVFVLVDFVRKPAILNQVILFFTACALANIAIVSIGMHTIHRFTFYNDWVIFLVLFMIIDFLSTQNNPADAH